MSFWKKFSGEYLDGSDKALKEATKAANCFYICIIILGTISMLALVIFSK